jgi:hypothetical protein
MAPLPPAAQQEHAPRKSMRRSVSFDNDATLEEEGKRRSGGGGANATFSASPSSGQRRLSKNECVLISPRTSYTAEEKQATWYSAQEVSLLRRQFQMTGMLSEEEQQHHEQVMEACQSKVDSVKERLRVKRMMLANRKKKKKRSSMQGTNTSTGSDKEEDDNADDHDDDELQRDSPPAVTPKSTRGGGSIAPLSILASPTKKARSIHHHGTSNANNDYHDSDIPSDQLPLSSTSLPVSSTL